MLKLCCDSIYVFTDPKDVIAQICTTRHMRLMGLIPWQSKDKPGRPEDLRMRHHEQDMRFMIIHGMGESMLSQKGAKTVHICGQRRFQIPQNWCVLDLVTLGCWVWPERTGPRTRLLPKKTLYTERVPAETLASQARSLGESARVVRQWP